MKRNHMMMLALMVCASVVCIPSGTRAATYQDFVGRYVLKITLTGDVETGDIVRESPYEDPPELILLPNNFCLFFEDKGDKKPEKWSCDLSENIVTLSSGTDGEIQKRYMVELVNGILAMTELAEGKEEGAVTITKYYFKSLMW